MSDFTLFLSDDKKAKEYVAKANGLGVPNPFNDREIIFDNESAFTVVVFGDKVILQSIRSFVPRSGAGTRLMHKLVELADEIKVPLYLNPVPFGTSAMTKRNLIEFYKKFGFVGNSKEMIRFVRSK